MCLCVSLYADLMYESSISSKCTRERVERDPRCGCTNATDEIITMTTMIDTTMIVYRYVTML